MKTQKIVRSLALARHRTGTVVTEQATRRLTTASTSRPSLANLPALPAVLKPGGPMPPSLAPQNHAPFPRRLGARDTTALAPEGRPGTSPPETTAPGLPSSPLEWASRAAFQRAANAPPLGALARGVLSRRQISIQPLADQVNHVAVHGDREVFEKLGIDGIDTSDGSKSLNFVSFPAKGYTGKVSGGGGMHRPVASTGTALSRLFQGEPGVGKLWICINGSYFNTGQLASDHLPDHAPIGETRIDGRTGEFVPVPRPYEEAYRELAFADGSKLQLGPVLFEAGRNMFPSAMLALRKYQFHLEDDPEPGDLNHAGDPNPRSGSSIPVRHGDGFPEGARVRFAVSIPPSDLRGAHSLGFKMDDWATVMTRLSTLDKDVQATAYNHDGGASAVLLVVDPTGRKIVEVAGSKGPSIRASNLVTFSKDED